MNSRLVVDDDADIAKFIVQLVQDGIAPTYVLPGKEVAQAPCWVNPSVSCSYYRVYKNVDEEGVPYEDSPIDSEHFTLRAPQKDAMHVVYDYATSTFQYWTTNDYKHPTVYDNVDDMVEKGCFDLVNYVGKH